MNSILNIENLQVGYGNVKAIWDVSLKVYSGEKIAIIGANGAGKSTLLKTVVGLLKPVKGKVLLNDSDISNISARHIANKGVAMVPEGRKIFSSLTVEENLKIGFKHSLNGKDRWSLETVYELFPILKENRLRLGTNMSGGQQQMLAIGRALMANPSILIFDELSLGLAPVATNAIYDKLEQIHDQEMTVVLVEQNVQRSLNFADRVYCLCNGRISLEGYTKELEIETIRKAYFGT